jgi:anti-anti-sigma regulatory factor
LAASPAAIAQPTPQELALSGAWTARGISAIEQQLESVRVPAKTEAIADGGRIEALDTAGAWVLQKLLLRLRDEGTVVTVRGLRPEFGRLLEVVAQHVSDQAAKPAPAASPPPTALESIGRSAEAAFSEAFALLSFVGENALALAGSIAHPARMSLPLQAVVADRRRSVERFGDVAGVQLLHGASVVSPHARVAVGLQLHAHRSLVLFGLRGARTHRFHSGPRGALAQPEK